MLRDFQSLLHASIPLARAMHLSVEALASGRLRLHAPLGPNVNDKGTAFGGSIATLATLAGWCETQRLLDQFSAAEQGAEIVVQHGETDYLLPISSDFYAETSPLDADELARFQKLLERRGLARLSVQVQVCDGGGQVAARFTGAYVVQLNS